MNYYPLIEQFQDVPQLLLFINKDLEIIASSKLGAAFLEKIAPNWKNRSLLDFMECDKKVKEALLNPSSDNHFPLLGQCNFKKIEKTYMIYFNPIFDEEGNFQFYFSSYRQHPDISENNAHDPYFEIFNKMNTGVVHGDHFTILKVNDAFTKLTGLSRATVEGKSAFKLAKKVANKTNFKKAKGLITKFLFNEKIDKELLPYDDKILEISTTNSNKTVMLRDATAETRHLQQLENLHQVAMQLAQDLPEKDYFNIVINAAQNILNFVIATIMIREDDQLVIKATNPGINFIGQQLPLAEGIYTKTYNKQRSYIVKNSKKNKSANPSHKNIRSSISIPIGRFGVFQAHSSQTDAFSQKDLQLAELLISHLKQALHRLETNKKIIKKDQNYQKLFENNAISTALISQAGNIQLVNQKFKALFEIDNESQYDIFDFFNTQGQDILHKRIHEITTDQNSPSYTFETKIITGKKEEKTVITYLKPMLSDQLLISFADITQLKEYEDELNNSLREKEILLKEIHHRVKNNLQLVSSFIRFYIKSHDPISSTTLIQEINAKINSISIVHERLYKSDSLKSINIYDYIKKLVPELLSTHKNRKIVVDYKMEKIVIDLNKSIPLGLILSEVLTNSIKYAFPDHFAGKPIITIKLSATDKFIMFNISDNGVGMQSEQKSFGYELVSLLTQQLGGNFNYENKNGVLFTLKIPRK